jgi:hypothetical protein
MTMRRLGATLAAVALVACHVGTRASSFAPAIDPEGVFAQIVTHGETFEAELLAVSDTSLLLLRSRTVVLASYAVIREATFQQVPGTVERGVAPDSATRERLRLISRFPQGVSREQLRTLLAAYGQSALDVLAR